MKLFEYGKIVPYRGCSWAVIPQSLVGWDGGGSIERAEKTTLCDELILKFSSLFSS